tara:strand:- start:106 stop:324 length:219 start_codon:yes stop_codon:yes gene_type:complete
MQGEEPEEVAALEAALLGAPKVLAALKVLVALKALGAVGLTPRVALPLVMLQRESLVVVLVFALVEVVSRGV